MLKDARRKLNDAYGLICRSGMASEFTRELLMLQHVEDVLWQLTTEERPRAMGGGS